MGYKTIKLGRTADRMIIDIRGWSISIWKNPRIWSLGRHGRFWLCLGPVEIINHKLNEYGV